MITHDTALLCILLVVMATGVGHGFVMLRPTELLVMEGSNAVFSCSPLYTVALPILERDGTVYHDSNRLTHTDHALNTPQGFRRYQLSNVSREESGSVLRCYMGGFFSNPITLSVYVLPEVKGPTGVVTLIEEDPARYLYSYTLSGFPPPHSVMWFRDGAPFNGGPQVSVVNNTSLSVWSPQRGDSGNYTLLAVSTVGQTSISLILNIVYNEFLESPQNATLAADHVVRLRCVHVFGWAYAWFSSNGPLYSSSDKVTVIDGGQTLVYGPLDHSDHLLSIYCVVHIRHSDKLFVSDQATLTVTSPPVVLAPPPKMATERSNVFFEFSVSGYPPPTNYTHSRGNNSRVTILTEGLFISNVSWRDAGVYTLTVSNAIGQTSNSTHLTVLYAPVVVPSSEPTVAQVFRPINLTCGADYHGNPTPRVTWTTPFGVELHSDQLHISNARYSDGGVYICSVRNRLGSQSTQETLLVLDPPSPPVDVVLLDVGSVWVLVTWEAPAAQHDRPITGYIVTATPLSSDSACVEVPCESVEAWADGSSANISGLVPDVRYTLTVSALANGSSLRSLPSSPLLLTTQTSVPGVGDVVSVVSGPGRCQVTWSLAYTGGSAVTHFNVQFQRINDSYWRNLTEQRQLLDFTVTSEVVEVPSEQRSSLVEGLEPLTVYQFRVCAVNVLGHGAYEVSLPVLSHEEGVPYRPEQPQLVGWSEQGPTLRVGLTTDSPVDLLVLALADGEVIARHTLLNHSRWSQLTLNMDTYRGDLQFQAVASNNVGVSEPSPPSLQARVYVTEVPMATATVGHVLGAVVGVVNCVVMTIILAMCGQMCYITHRKRQSKDIAAAETVTESPLSARMMFMGNLRPSPDSELELSSPRRPDHFVTIATTTPPTPLSITSLV